MLMERNEQINYGRVISKKRVNKKTMKVKSLGNGKYVRMETRYRVARFIAGLTIILAIAGLGYALKDRFVKVVTPTKYLDTLNVEKVATDLEENTYFDNFISTLDVSNEIDIRVLRDYIMDLNNMDSVDDYHSSYSLLVPVLNEKNVEEIPQLVKE